MVQPTAIRLTKQMEQNTSPEATMMGRGGPALCPRFGPWLCSICCIRIPSAALQYWDYGQQVLLTYSKHAASDSWRRSQSFCPNIPQQQQLPDETKRHPLAPRPIQRR